MFALERSSGLGAILNEMGRATAVETTIVVVSLLDGGKLGRGPCYCCCWGCGVGGRLNRACWGGWATHLPGILF
jgi:hypothetical protein